MVRNILRMLDAQAREKIRKTSFPDWIPPMLATLVDEPFSNPEWMYECKFDGIRCIAYKNGSHVSLMTRNKKLANNTYPLIVKFMKQQPAKQLIVDGEIVAFEEKVTSFKKLQKLMNLQQEEKIKAIDFQTYYYVFDILYINGYRVTNLPLIARKKFLEILSYSDFIRFSDYWFKDGVKLFKQACKKGWEGIIAKEKSSIYESKRSRKWLKFKCVKNQELVIGGYTDPTGSRIGFGALLLGYYKNGQLMYAGKVGTGFDDQMLKLLYKKMRQLSQKECPFVNYDDSYRNVHFIKPKLVGEVNFTEWTPDNKLRHPSFQGLRDDKKPEDVVKEF